LGLTGLQTADYTPSAGKTKVLFVWNIHQFCRLDIKVRQQMPVFGLPQLLIEQSKLNKRVSMARKFLSL